MDRLPHHQGAQAQLTPEVVRLALARELADKVGVGLQGRAPVQNRRVVAPQRQALVVAPAALVREEYLVALQLPRLCCAQRCKALNPT